jgi:iron complex transport system substrate-binding protein
MIRRILRCATASVLVLGSSLVTSLAGAQPIERIVSLAPNLTELAFAAGAGERVVGTVEYSDEPAAARKIPRVGDAFRVDAERILQLQPDLVLAWASGTPQPTIARLRSLGLEVREFTTQRIADVPRVVRELGELVGTQASAAQAATRFESDMARLRTQYSARRSLSVFLQVNTRPLFTVNGEQIMSELVQVCGGRNVFADLQELAPQIALEAVMARDPEVIVASDAEQDALSEWRRWPQLRAVRTGNLYMLPANDLTRATTRLTSGATQLCETLEKARTRATLP